MNTEVAASDIVKEDVDSTHPSWLVSLYKKFFKPGLGDKANVSAAEEVASSVGQPTPINNTIRASPAGEDVESAKNDKGIDNIKPQSQEQDHTIVDLPSTESTGSTERPATSAFIFPSSYTPVEPTVDQSKNTLVIKNLPFKYKPVDLEALLSEHQAKPKNVRLLRDDAGRFSGMAFIRCISKEEAQRLIFCMNDLDIGGRNIQVEFKMKKKKKAGLRASSDDASGLSSSSEDLPYGSRLRTSAENANEAPTTTVSTQIQPSQLSLQQEKKSAAPSGPRKLAVSAEHNFSDKFRKPPQMRRKSTSAVLDTLYSHSALFKTHPTLTQSVLPSIRPIRQPLGPDGKSNGFSLEYRKSRGHP